jgi:GAF domain-containing protein/HAMP domain-containing protein
MALVLLPLVLVPLIVLGAVAYLRSRAILEAQAATQLVSAVQSQVATIRSWTEQRQQRLQIGTQRTPLSDAAAELISRTTPGGAATARQELDELLTRQGVILFSDIAIVRANDGEVLASTNPEWEGQVFAPVAAGEVAQDALGTYAIFADPMLSANSVSFASVAPMRATGGSEADSLLIGVNSDLRLVAMMEEIQAFWEQRGVYIVQRGGTFLALAPDIIVELPRYATAVETRARIDHPIFSLAQDNPSGTAQYAGLDGVSVFGAYEWIPELDMGVVVELPQEEVFSDLNSLAPFTVGLIAIVSVLALVVVIFATNRMLRPLGQLTQFAERISRGEWEHRAPDARNDELGQLARAFNRMSAEIRGLITGLEDKVRERTLEVERRALQVQTAAEVARDASAVQDVNQMLDETVRLISERFDLYHAGVFLIEDSGDYAVLQAASSEGGRRMLRRGHKLAVGKVGIVGYVTGTGRPRIALDVGADAVHFANPDLPDTRSEMALPLRAGEKFIGALDVQSAEANAFDEGDIAVLETMADQLALAIENARLLDTQRHLAGQRRMVIDTSQKLSEQLSLDQLLAESSQIICDAFNFRRVAIAFEEGGSAVVRSTAAMDGFDPVPLGSQSPIGKGLMGRAMALKSPIKIEGALTGVEGFSSADERSRNSLAAPLFGRGRVIGALAIEIEAPGGIQESDVEIIELLAAQVAVAMENARLFEETQQSLEQLDAIYRREVSDAWAQRSLEFVMNENGEQTDSGHSIEAPISLRGEIIGQLGLAGADPSQWSEEDQLILNSVAEEVGEALEQIRLMEEVQRRANQLQAAAEIARDSTGLLDVDTMVSRAVNLIQERLKLFQTSLYLRDGSDSSMDLIAAAGEAASELQEASHRGSSKLMRRVLATGDHHFSQDISREDLYEAHPSLPDRGSELALPLKIADDVIGILDVLQDSTNSLSDDDVTVLQILADQLALAIQNARLFKEAQRQAEREKTVVDITRKIHESDNVESMLKTALQEMRRALGAKRARIQILPAKQEDGKGSNPIADAIEEKA